MESKLPQYVSNFTLNNSEKVSIISNDSIISSTEECLKNWFKCTKFTDKMNACFATFNDENKLIKHFEERHKSNQQLFCIHCNRVSDQEKAMYSPEALIVHMNQSHRYRRFQCNQCLYRSISVDHINIHQSIIHVDLHNASLLNKQIDGKICKIIECPPIDTSNQTPVLPKLYHFYDKYHQKRKNIDGNHDNHYQCLYCDFIDQLKRAVIEHCVQRHADYPIMFYNPEPVITSTQSPKANTTNDNTNHISQIDLFSGKHETQENSVSSTGLHEAIDLESDCSEEAISDKNHSNNVQKRADDNDCEIGGNVNKKQRISKIQKGGIANTSSLSQRFANSSSFKSRPSAKNAAILNLRKMARNTADKSSLIKIPKRDGKWLPNQTIRKNQTHRNRPQLYVSPPKSEHQNKFICLLCTGNVSQMKQNNIDSHLIMFHKNCRVKYPNLPFCCAYCEIFCGTEPEVNCHSFHCPKKISGKSRKAFVFIVSEDEHKIENKAIHGKEERVPSSDSSDDENPINLNRREKCSNNQIELSDKRKLNPLNVETSHHLRAENSHTITTNNNESNARKTLENNSENTSDMNTNMSNQFNQSKDNTKKQFKTTTIELVLPESDEDIEIESKSQFVCLFCDINSIDEKTAKVHLETHFPDINRMTDDYQITKPVHKWFKNFIEKQESLFEKMIDSNDYNEFNRYKCPICVRIGNSKNVKSKRFKHYWELKAHYWEHTCWQPVVCNLCKPEYHLPNCDHTIVRHLNTKHNEKLVSDKNPLIRKVAGNKMKYSCPYDQRLALEQTFISYFPYQVLDSHIENTLKTICQKQESKLRQIHNCPQELPQIKLNRLPQIDFDDEYMVQNYLKSLKRKENSERISKSSNSNKVHDEIDLGSSSDESYDRIPPIIRNRKQKHSYRRLFSDQSSEEFNNNSIIDNNPSIPLVDDRLSDCELLTHVNDEQVVQKLESIRSDSIEELITENDPSSKLISNESIETLNEFSEENPIDLKDETSETIIKKRSDSTIIHENEPSTSSGISPSVKKKVVCHDCNELFDGGNDVKLHYKTAHPGLSARYTRAID